MSKSNPKICAYCGNLYTGTGNRFCSHKCYNSHPRSKEHIQKVVESRKGFRHTEEAKRKIAHGNRGYMRLGITPAKRFWSKVEILGLFDCWNYQGCKTLDGYGQFRLGDKIWKAHRFAWILINGEIPEDKSVCHKCDNPACCNTAHLFLGTHKENMEDMAKKGRVITKHGENSPQSKLSEKQVLQIREKFTNGSTRKQLAGEYNVTRENICYIVKRETWQHI